MEWRCRVYNREGERREGGREGKKGGGGERGWDGGQLICG